MKRIDINVTLHTENGLYRPFANGIINFNLMTMKISKFLTVAFIALAVASCGKKQEEAKEDYSAEEMVDTPVTRDVAEDNEATEAPAEIKDDSNAQTANNWDSLLDEYESYCNKVASLYKKAISGDMGAMTEYASALEQAQSLSEKLENAKGDFLTSSLRNE